MRSSALSIKAFGIYVILTGIGLAPYRVRPNPAVDSAHIAYSESAFAELAPWRLPTPLKGSAHAFEYRLAYVVRGDCVLRYDNEAGKGDQPSELSGIPQATISAIENGRVNSGVERAKAFARALNCHPAVLASMAS